MGRYDVWIRMSATAGFLLSLYTYIVERQIDFDPEYVAMCDISDHMSCSKAFTSEYGKGFGIVAPYLGENSILNQPNCIPGMAFYALAFLLSYSDSSVNSYILFGLGVISCAVSFYLACILHFVLQDFCIVCISTYFVNAIFLFLGSKRMNYPSIPRATKEKKM